MINYKKHRGHYLIPAALFIFALFINTVGIDTALANSSFGSFFKFSNYKNFHFNSFKNYFDSWRRSDNDRKDKDKKERHKSHDDKLDCGFDRSALFNVENMLPGDVEEKNISITNNSNSAVYPILKGFKTGPDGELEPLFETVLDFTILENDTSIYSNKLQGFFSDSGNFGQVSLSQLDPDETKDFVLKVEFPENSGNEYQLKKVVFKLECDHRVVATPTPSPKPTPTPKKHNKDRR